MSDAALLAAIREAPDDDAPRLVYADWLDEQDQPERAEFIRVQCEVARIDSAALRQREAELLVAHHDTFVGPLAAPHLRFRFRRGFICGFGHTGLFRQHFQGRLRVPLNDYLSFHPDGQVVGGRTAVQPCDAIRLFQLGRLPVGTYQLKAFELPVRVVFTLARRGQTFRYEATFERTEVRARVHDQTIDIRYEQRYTHVPVPGFDSFTET
jgi:uncharacterized protein (TIGR02996 family)